MNVDSTMVLWGQTLAYTLYALAIISVVGWFALRVTRAGQGSGAKAGLFYAFAAFLVVCGVSLHIITYNTIPWAALDLKRASITPDRTFDISVAQHRFLLPAPKLQASCGEKVLFNVTSSDLTYGFGLFRQDNSMVFQMQVVPGHRNDILWVFDRPGVYTIRSTEYSGPAGIGMIERDAVEISCANAPAN
jgi:cytochrome c oxidase subunit II